MHSTDEVPKVANTYAFTFAHETKAWVKEQPNSGIRGSLSDDHVPYILGYPLMVGNKDLQLYSGFNNEDRGISRVLMHYVSNFAKSGDPSKPFPMSTESTIEDRFHSTPWPQYNQASREAYLEISDRPRVKNYYRNSYVGFWTQFLPRLNRRGEDDDKVPEEHNFLPDHFNKHSFFGVVRPYSSFHNEPFPPPPLPPTPLPKDVMVKKPPTTVAPKDERLDGKTDVKVAEYSNALALTVAVGAGFLVLNMILFCAISKTCADRNRKSKKQLKYQSYTTGHPNTEINYIPNSPLNQQEPLLANSSKSSTPGVIRPSGPTISPTCPRHGRAAQIAMLAASRANSVGSSLTFGATTAGPTLEEVQV
jgi:hypothetical protein